ncbi:hypothetical protein evm_003039 [Chilo suppressalis]|nr:hypothetical protein evm_003039 [Chilo suppressalis]
MVVPYLVVPIALSETISKLSSDLKKNINVNRSSFPNHWTDQAEIWHAGLKDFVFMAITSLSLEGWNGEESVGHRHPAKRMRATVFCLIRLRHYVVPTFVAKELHKLPPVTFDHVDVTRLLKDINLLKANLADVVNKLEESNNTIGELRAQLESLSSAAWTSRSPEASHVNTRRVAHSASVGSLESAYEDQFLPEGRVFGV